MKKLFRSVVAVVLAPALAHVPSETHAVEIFVEIPDVLVINEDASQETGTILVAMTGTGVEQMGAYTLSIDVLPRAGSSGLLSLTDARDVPGQLIDSTNFSFAPVGAFNLVGDRTDSGTVAAVDGDMFELDYLVPAGAHGTFDLAFLFSPPNFPDTEVQDGLGLPLDTTFINGSIEVQIPEPAIGLLVLTVVSVRGVRHRHRGQGSAPIVV